MKKIVLTLTLFVLVSTLFAQELVTNTKPENLLPAGKAIFTWEKTSFDFGKIQVNKPATYEFTFTNTGEVPLVITSVRASCGCTVAKYTKDPISPGSKGFVIATYDAAKVGVFTKTITVNANTEDRIVQLAIRGEVVE